MGNVESSVPNRSTHCKTGGTGAVKGAEKPAKGAAREAAMPQDSIDPYTFTDMEDERDMPVPFDYNGYGKR